MKRREAAAKAEKDKAEKKRLELEAAAARKDYEKKRAVEANALKTVWKGAVQKLDANGARVEDSGEQRSTTKSGGENVRINSKLAGSSVSHLNKVTAAVAHLSDEDRKSTKRKHMKPTRNFAFAPEPISVRISSLVIPDQFRHVDEVKDADGLKQLAATIKVLGLLRPVPVWRVPGRAKRYHLVAVFAGHAHTVC